MRPFTHLTGVAAALGEANIDTDQILAGRFLKTISRDGLGRYLFHSMRFAEDGCERAAFVLNVPPWRSAKILVSLDNFGCGSSREHAPWALLDFGIRALIAPSFADIFRNNCHKNGILTVTLDRSDVMVLLNRAAHPETAVLTIDLPAQTVTTSQDEVFEFAVAPATKEQLLLGLDDIAGTENSLGEISTFEEAITYPCPPIPRPVVSQEV